MVKNIKAFLKNIKSKQAIMGAIILSLMFIIAATSVIIDPRQIAQAGGYETQWETQGDYTDFLYYKIITIESDYLYETLTNFPVLVHDDTGNLSGILANGSDIAFYDSTNTTQYNHEIERFDSVTGELWAWVNITSISSVTDTIFYMYYNDSDGGRTVGHNPQYTWDQHYKGVWHCNGSATGTQYDSTVNDNDAFFVNNGTDNTIDTGKVGYGIYPSGGGDYYQTADSDSLDFIDYITVEVWIFSSTLRNYEEWFAKGEKDNISMWSWKFTTYANGNTQFDVNSTSSHSATTGAGTTVSGRWYYLTGTIDGDLPAIYVNLTKYTNEHSNLSSVDFGVILASGIDDNRAPTGKVDEYRISRYRRAPCWINTSFHTMNETSGFMTLSLPYNAAEGPTTSTYTAVGLPNSRITWAGTAGTTVWCNTSGDAYETLEVNMSVNSTDNVSELRFWIGDLNDTGEWINASNISVVFSSDNSTWKGGDDSINTTSFTDGGSNVSVNETQWTHANGMYGDNPFTAGLGGISDKNVSIWVRFKITIPSGASTDDFWSSSSTAWKIYIGRYT